MLVTVNFKYLTLFLAALAIYLLWMDVGFYLELQKMVPRSLDINKTTPYIYSPFHPITVKLLMLPPFIQVRFFENVSKATEFELQPNT